MGSGVEQLKMRHLKQPASHARSKFHTTTVACIRSSSMPEQSHKCASKLHFSSSQAKFFRKSTSDIAKEDESRLRLHAIFKQLSASDCKSTLAPSSSAGNIILTSDDCQMKAEALWAMKTVSSNYSFASASGVKDSFTTMFPDSLIASSMTPSSTKMQYLISDDLGPYLSKKMISDMDRPTTPFTLMRPPRIK